MAIGFLSDLHVGSKLAPCPPQFRPKTGAAASAYTWECLQRLLKEWPKKLDALILLGDLADGIAPKDRGAGLWDADPLAQEDMVVATLRPFCARAKRVYRHRGTRYHEQFWGGLARAGRELGITPARDGVGVLDYNLGGQLLNCAHHPMGGGTLYMATALDREQVWSAVAVGAGKVKRPRWIVRGHRHCWAQDITETATSVSCPCWKLPGPYEEDRSYWRWQPSLGAVLMIKSALSPDGSGWVFVPRLFALPTREVQAL